MNQQEPFDTEQTATTSAGLQVGAVVENGESPTEVASVADSPTRYSDSLAISQTDREQGLAIREKIGWGSQYFPPIEHANEQLRFYRLCDVLCEELVEIEQFLDDGMVSEEGSGSIAEIHRCLEELYNCRFGESDCLKNIVVCLQFQVNNAAWRQRHVSFLKDLATYLQARSYITDEDVEHCYDLVEDHELDVFRGTVSEPDTIKKYKIVEVQEDHA